MSGKPQRSLPSMSSALKNINGTATIRWPQGLRGFARQILVLAWVAFWLNTAIFPCAQTFAAVFGEHSESQPVAGHQAAQDCHDDQPHQLGRNPYSPCGSFLSANAVTISQSALLPTEHTPSKSIAPAADVSPVALNIVNRFAPHEIPLPVRLYWPELRLLL